MQQKRLQTLQRFAAFSLYQGSYSLTTVRSFYSTVAILHYFLFHSSLVPFFTHHYSPTNIQNKKSFSKSIRPNKRTYPTVCLPFSFIQTRLELIKIKIMSKIAVYHPSSILSPEKIGKYKKEPYICLNIKYQ